MFDTIRPDIDLPQEVLHECAQELSLLEDLLGAASVDDLVFTEASLCALTRKLRAVATAVESIAWQITPGGRPRAA